MATDNIIEHEAHAFVTDPWEDLTDSEIQTFRCRVNVYEEEGGYCAYAADLPGVVSEGDTKKEAIERIRDAYRGVIFTYLESEVKVPWRKPIAPRDNEIQQSIEVEVGQASER